MLWQCLRLQRRYLRSQSILFPHSLLAIWAEQLSIHYWQECTKWMSHVWWSMISLFNPCNNMLSPIQPDAAHHAPLCSWHSLSHPPDWSAALLMFQVSVGVPQLLHHPWCFMKFFIPNSNFKTDYRAISCRLHISSALMHASCDLEVLKIPFTVSFLNSFYHQPCSLWEWFMWRLPIIVVFLHKWPSKLHYPTCYWPYLDVFPSQNGSPGLTLPWLWGLGIDIGIPNMCT